PIWLASFRGRRAIVHDTIRAIDDGRLTTSQVGSNRYFSFSAWHPWTPSQGVNEAINNVTGRRFRRTNATALFRHLTWVIERLKESPDALATRSREWAALRQQLPENVAAFVNDLADVMTIRWEQDAFFRCAFAALAAERFRRDRGRWPTA